MGYPDHHFHTAAFRFVLTASLVLLLFFFLPATDVVAADPAPSSGLPPGNWDHLIITDKSMISSFTVLADHRTAQGLNCRVISLQEIRHWSWQTNLTEAIRWFISTASQQWGTRYVLLGGGGEFIPIPLGYFESPFYSWDIPMDLYYAAPHGEWDLDGDGILGEYEDDAPDLTTVVALGRAPVSNPSEARTVVDKIIAFEAAGASETHDVLLAAEVGTPYPWVPGTPVQFDFAWFVEEVVDILTGWEAIGNIQLLYQNWEEPPYGEPLSQSSFLDALNIGQHRFSNLMVHGIANTWSLGPDLLSPDDLEDLAEMDHSLFMVPWVPEAADCREESVLKTLLMLPEGGCVGALAPSSMFYIVPADQIGRQFWEHVVSGTWDRVGDAYRQTLVDHLQNYPPNSANMSALQCLSIVGDPALLFLPAAEDGFRPARNTATSIVAGASPNPFNPATEISFVLPGDQGTVLPTIVEIYDLAGRRLTRLLDADIAPGPHSVRWRGEDATGRKAGSGLFFALIKSGKHETVVKLVLVE